MSPALPGSPQPADATVKAFESLGLCRQLADAAASLGWKDPSSIQKQAVPHLLQGKDVIGLAQTGSGKTGAFALPILQALLDKPQALFALVLSPTRELAIQISEQFEALGAGIGVKCAVLVGGVDMMAQAIALGKRPHVIVGTPGRVVDHLSNTKAEAVAARLSMPVAALQHPAAALPDAACFVLQGFSLKLLKHLVLDEADRLLNMDFEQEIDQILKVIPKERRTQLFSATMTNKVQKLQRACLTDPVKVEVAQKYSTVDTLRQQYIFVPAKYKECYLAFFLTELAGATFMLFMRTCDATRRLALMLRNLGFDAIPIHGQMPQAKRIGALTKFKAGERSILVATDVASRGLDIPAVDVVVNFDVPQNSKDYIHRVGRTARAGRSGRSLTIVTQYDVEQFQRIEQLTGQQMEKYPTEQEAVLVLLERVGDAQRLAVMQMREAEKGKKGKRRQSADDDAQHTGLRHGGGARPKKKR